METVSVFAPGDAVMAQQTNIPILSHSVWGFCSDFFFSRYHRVAPEKTSNILPPEMAVQIRRNGFFLGEKKSMRTWQGGKCV